MKAPFPFDPVLTAITVAYRNPAYIADSVFPRVPVGLPDFKYWEFPIEETFSAPDTHVGRKSRPNEVDLTATEKAASTEDHGLDDPIPSADITNAPPKHSPVDRAVVQLTDYVALGREQRAANLAFTAANYPTGNKTLLSGTSQWNDFANSDPIGDISTALDACLIRPNIGVFGQTTYSKLSQHPDIIKAVNGTSGNKGIARRQAVADLFELEEVLVGQSRLNTAKKGQTATLSRVWGKHAAFHYRDKNADTRGGLTFGFTAEHGERVSGQEADSNIGMRGGQRVRVGESVKELIIASQAGYIIENAVF